MLARKGHDLTHPWKSRFGRSDPQGSESLDQVRGKSPDEVYSFAVPLPVSYTKKEVLGI